jgi:hypothetical protein
MVCLVFLSCSGCMDPTPDYDECVEIETARCDIREACLGDAAFDASYPKFDGATCVAYAKEHCRTRKIIGDYTPRQLDACINAMQELTCQELIPRGVDETKTLWDCAFIDDRDAGPRPAVTPEDAGAGDAGAQ